MRHGRPTNDEQRSGGSRRPRHHTGVALCAFEKHVMVQHAHAHNNRTEITTGEIDKKPYAYATVVCSMMRLIISSYQNQNKTSASQGRQEYPQVRCALGTGRWAHCMMMGSCVGSGLFIPASSAMKRDQEGTTGRRLASPPPNRPNSRIVPFFAAPAFASICRQPPGV